MAGHMVRRTSQDMTSSRLNRPAGATTWHGLASRLWLDDVNIARRHQGGLDATGPVGTKCRARFSGHSGHPASGRAISIPHGPAPVMPWGTVLEPDAATV